MINILASPIIHIHILILSYVYFNSTHTKKKIRKKIVRPPNVNIRIILQMVYYRILMLPTTRKIVVRTTICKSHSIENYLEINKHVNMITL